jgi:hypothetical protein
VVIAVMIKIHVDIKAGKLTGDTMVPIRAMEVFALDLCLSKISMLLSVSAIMSHIRIHSTMQAFLWGRKANGLMEFASLLRVVTQLVAKFPLSMWAAKVLPTIWMERYFNQMLMVLFLGHQQGLTNQVGQRGGTGSPWVAKDYFHAV